MRPLPPEELLYGRLDFIPAAGVIEWVQENIVSENGPLHNPEHAHLKEAVIGVLWTNFANIKQGRHVLGMAEIPRFQGNKWSKARQEIQIEGWFGVIPDFLITLDANYCADCTDMEFAALIEHEMYHCAQATDEFGVPAFNRDTGLPKFAIRGHDVEEFVGVVRRYGITSPAMASLIDAASKAPQASGVNLARACGTCLLKSA